jgi:hypothetical protein
MDHSRLRNLISKNNLVVLGFVLFFEACSSHQAARTEAPAAPRTILQSSLRPLNAIILSEQFLEWQKGFAIRVRDHEQGLLVTEWTQDSPFERHRVTLRSTDDPPGSVLSAHFAQEVLEEGKWKQIPSTGQTESQLLSEIDLYLQKSPAAQKSTASGQKITGAQKAR